MFLGADSCAGGAATGYAPLIHGPLTPVNWVIEGMSADALVPVMGSGVAVFLVQDRDTSEDLILHYGGIVGDRYAYRDIVAHKIPYIA